MADTPQQLPRTLWIGIVLLLVVLCLAYAAFTDGIESHSSPGGAARNRPGRRRFTLTNQDGQVTTLADLSNRVWITDIIFTRCAGSCPIMSKQMESLQDALPPASRARLVTLTTDPILTRRRS